MKDANGFYPDILQSEAGQARDTVGIRMNVDNLEEAVALLTSHGFTRSPEFSETAGTSSSRFAIMISPSRFVMNVVQHIRAS